MQTVLTTYLMNRHLNLLFSLLFSMMGEMYGLVTKAQFSSFSILVVNIGMQEKWKRAKK